ncbi:hypothetical protein IPH25_02760 [bacterium]|nr:MAG: hypothetical protein IPG37_04900 [bacterium]QQR61388.1 MAG: hypothetical protein IPH25_02760 [bacterium]QQR63091.1 MAG: hypothetical protein IPH67_01280 [bacterium]
MKKIVLLCLSLISSQAIKPQQLNMQLHGTRALIGLVAGTACGAVYDYCKGKEEKLKGFARFKKIVAHNMVCVGLPASAFIGCGSAIQERIRINNAQTSFVAWAQQEALKKFPKISVTVNKDGELVLKGPADQCAAFATKYGPKGEELLKKAVSYGLTAAQYTTKVILNVANEQFKGAEPLKPE